MTLLKPCPFCGGEAEIKSPKLITGEVRYCVCCKKNCVRTTSITVKNNDFDSARDDVIYLWNMRGDDRIEEYKKEQAQKEVVLND